MDVRQFQVNRSNLDKHRIVELPAPELDDGEILTRIERFALTANNVTYGVVGERIGYWKFFPVEQKKNQNWGVIPAWGFAEVVESKAGTIKKGERLYGYFPMGTHLVIKPEKVTKERLIDASEHRKELPPVYNSYLRVGEPNEQVDNERALLHPLFATSYCLHDYFKANGWFEAEQVVITSASSKTAIGVGYALMSDIQAPSSVGLTSPAKLDYLAGLGVYDSVVPYDSLLSVDPTKASVVIDMSGSGDILAKLHIYLGPNMKFCSNVGLTHWPDNTMKTGFIKERSAMFFAPGHIKKRTEEWGKGEFERKANQFWLTASKKSRAWLNIETIDGLDEIVKPFKNLVAGTVPPQVGLIVTVGD